MSYLRFPAPRPRTLSNYPLQSIRIMSIRDPEDIIVCIILVLSLRYPPSLFNRRPHPPDQTHEQRQ